MNARVRHAVPSSIEPRDKSGATIYEQLRDDIIHGRFKSNERLKVAELATRMGTSTNPVREALQQLRGEGFVIMTPNRAPGYDRSTKSSCGIFAKSRC